MKRRPGLLLIVDKNEINKMQETSASRFHDLGTAINPFLARAFFFD
jgi:hypothetical protein